MKSLIILSVVVMFLVISGLHGLMWLLHGITGSYQQLIDGESTKAEFRDFMGKIFLLILVSFGIYHVFFIEVPNLLGR